VIIIKDTNLNSIQVLFFVLAVILFYLLLKPLLTAFLTSIILTYLFYPVYKRIKKLLKSQSLSIFVTLIFIVIIFLLPFVYVASQIPGQASNMYGYVQENIIGNGFFDLDCKGSDSMICNTFNVAGNLKFLDIDSTINTVFKKITSFAGSAVASIPNIILSIAFALFISFFLFKDGKKLVNSFISIVPLDNKTSNKLAEQFATVTKSVVFAHLIVAIVQGAIGTLGFFLFGIPSPLFWGVVMAIFALLPVIGPAIIWLPASIFLIINGIVLNSYFIIGKGIGLIVFGVLIISTIDNILRVKLIGDTGEVHPLTVFIGLIGGVNLFGLTGIFIGPILLSLLVTYIKDFSNIYKYKGG